MREKRYILLGDPTPLARARMGNQKMWDSQKEHKLVAGLHLRQQHNDEPFFEGPILLEMSFYLKRPLTGPNRKRHYHSFRPDLDNLIKFIADISNGVLYDDDCIIASITARKIYDEEPRSEFTVRELYAEEPDACI